MAMTPMNSPSDKQDIEALLMFCLPEKLRQVRDFEDWYDPIDDAAQVAATRVYEEVGLALESEKLRLRDVERCCRDLWGLFPAEGGGLTKTVGSIRSKIGRQLRDGGDWQVLSMEQVQAMILAFPDLGRFRIVCDFPTDVNRAIALLVPVSEKGLLGKYPLKDGLTKDYVFDLALRHPAKGHRARQFAVQVANSDGLPPIYIEIQVMTLLQHAWDRRNHPMYEWTREGGKLPAELVVNDVAVAETLHLADQQAGRNWEEFLRHARPATKEADHT